MNCGFDFKVYMSMCSFDHTQNKKYILIGIYMYCHKINICTITQWNLKLIRNIMKTVEGKITTFDIFGRRLKNFSNVEFCTVLVFNWFSWTYRSIFNSLINHFRPTQLNQAAMYFQTLILRRPIFWWYAFSKVIAHLTRNVINLLWYRLLIIILS